MVRNNMPGRAPRAWLLCGVCLAVSMGATAAAAQTSAFHTPEYFASGGLDQIGADEAYALGYTGAGVTVAVFDTGIDPAHPEFAGKLNSGYDFFFDTPDLSDLNGHGTHVAGIAAARRDGAGMHGVAYDTDIMAFNILVGATPASAMEDLFAGVDQMIDSGVRIASNSWVTFFDRNDPDALDYLYTNFKYAQDNGIIFVFAAGNFSDTKPWDPADIPEIFPDLQKQVIAVVAVDANNTIAGFSNRCGDNAPWCIAAPGVDITSTIPGGGYVALSGTSQATPVVSGALAVLEQAFPFMTSDQLVQTLMTTATPLGDPAIYGRGLVNLGAAVRGPAAFETDWEVDTDGWDVVWANGIAGTGGLIKSGDGVLTLNGWNTYSGGTFSDGGWLEVGDEEHPLAALWSSVTVGWHGGLSGHGTIFGDVVNNGIVAPGGSIGVLSIAGDYDQTAEGWLWIDLTPAAASRLGVGGTASLNGLLRLEYQPGAYTAAVHTLVRAGSVTGRFANIEETSPPDMLRLLSYTPTQVDLSLQPASNDIVPSLTTAQIEAVHRSNHDLLARAASGTGPWIEVGGVFDRFDASAGARGYDTNGSGLAFGGAGRVSPQFALGAAAQFTRLDVDQNGGAPTGGNADYFQGAVYGGYALGQTALAASATFGFAEVDTLRQFAAISGSQAAHGAYDVWVGSTAVQASRRLTAGTFSVTPQAGLAYVYLHRDAGTERGAPGFNLIFQEGHTESLRAFAGAEVSRAYGTRGGAEILPVLRVRYSRELLSNHRSVDAMLAVGSNPARTLGVFPEKDVLEVGGGLRARVGDRLDLRLDGDFALPVGNYASYAVSAGLRFRF